MPLYHSDLCLCRYLTHAFLFILSYVSISLYTFIYSPKFLILYMQKYALYHSKLYLCVILKFAFKSFCAFIFTEKASLPQLIHSIKNEIISFKYIPPMSGDVSPMDYCAFGH